MNNNKMTAILIILVTITTISTCVPIKISANDLDYEENFQENSSVNDVFFTSIGALETTKKPYDYGINPSTYPLPIKDFEIIFNPSLQTLKYRFKDDSIGKDGLRENQVSQRFITRLIENKTRSYEIDMRANDDVMKYTLEIPYSIYQAFSEQKISLKIMTNEMNIYLPPDFTDIAAVKELDSFDDDIIIKLVSETIPNTYQTTSTNAYIFPPQKLSIFFSTPKENISIENLDKIFEIEMKIDKKYNWKKEDILAIKNKDNSEVWEPIESHFDYKNSVLKFETYDIGIYSAIFSNIAIR